MEQAAAIRTVRTCPAELTHSKVSVQVEQRNRRQQENLSGTVCVLGEKHRMGSGGGIKLENLLTTLQEPHRSSNGNTFPLATTSLRKVF